MEQSALLLEDGRLKFQTICRRNGIKLTDDQREMLDKYVDSLLDWNSRVNLISRTNTQSIWLSHILHSISVLLAVDVPLGINILDLGTGGGLPGIPISIVRPDLKFTLLDSIRKKTIAVEDIVARLALSNVSVVSARAEDLSKKQIGSGFHSVFTRAVASLGDLIRWSKRLVRRDCESELAPGGTKITLPIPSLLALKGGDLGEEIRAAVISAQTREISVVDLAFDGSDEIGLSDKKLVLVHL